MNNYRALPFEERLFQWLYRRWRTRATVWELLRHRDWLVLDIHVKCSAPRGTPEDR